jgi:hypothetical protein
MPNTLFTRVDYALGSLMDSIGNGQIGLPDIQRPFVWKTSKSASFSTRCIAGIRLAICSFGKPGRLALGRSAAMTSNSLRRA